MLAKIGTIDLLILFKEKITLSYTFPRMNYVGIRIFWEATVGI